MKQRPRRAAVDACFRFPLLVSVGLDVMLGSFTCMMRRMRLMSLGYMRVVSRCLVIAVFMMLGSFSVVIGRKLMVFSSLGVMMRRFLRHSVSFRFERFRTANLRFC
jgi:hypothetical protein